jgi:hypothetical protein
MKRIGARGWLVSLALLVLGGALTGGVVAAQFNEPDVVRDLQAAIETDPVQKAVEIAAEGKLPRRGVYVQPTSAGFLCLWDAPSASSHERSGGCNPVDDSLGGKALSASFGYDGGPDIDNVRDARLIGLASAEVARIDVLMSDGTSRKVHLEKTKVAGTEYRVFGYRIRPSDLRKGVGPTAIIAVNDSGEEIGRQATGFVD